MNSNLNNRRSLSYLGVHAQNPPDLFIFERDPLSSDYKSFNIGDLWLRYDTYDVWMLANKGGRVATWIALGSSGSNTFSSITVTPGDVTVTNGKLNINSINYASTLRTYSTGEVYGLPDAGAPATEAKVYHPNDAGLVQWGNLTSGTGSVTITTTSTGINIEAAGGTASDFFTTDDSNTVSPNLGGNLYVYGGTNINTVGDTDAHSVTINLDGNISLDDITLANPLPVTSGGTGLGSLTDHSVLVGSGVNDITPLPVGSTGEVLKGVNGSDPVWGSVDLTSDLTGTLPVDSGGTGKTSFTDHVVLLGNGTSSIGEVSGVGNAGQILTSNGPGLDPTWQAGESGGDGASDFITDSGTATVSSGKINIVGGPNIQTTGSSNVVTVSFNGTLPTSYGGTGSTSHTQHAVLLGDGSNPITEVVSLGSSGQVLTSNGAGTKPEWKTTGDGIIWNVITTTPITLTIDNGYVMNYTSLITANLPTTCEVGKIFRITGMGSGGWRIGQNIGQTIYFGTSTTTTGTAGYLESTQDRDSILLVCVVADTDFNVLSSVGDITVI